MSHWHKVVKMLRCTLCLFKFVWPLTLNTESSSAADLSEGKTNSSAGISLTRCSLGLLRNLPFVAWLTDFTVICMISPWCPSTREMGCLSPDCASVYFQSLHVLERTASSSTEPSVSRQLLEPEPVPLSKVSDRIGALSDAWCLPRGQLSCPQFLHLVPWDSCDAHLGLISHIFLPPVRRVFLPCIREE